MPGLCLLSELLPLPLPLTTGRPLSPGEKDRCVAVRKLWAANLAPLGEPIYQLLHHLSPAAVPSLTHALRRACISLADLAPQMAELVLRPLLDVALQNIKAESDYTSILYMLASLASHSGCKAAMLHLLMTEQYSSLLPTWCDSVGQSLQDSGPSSDAAEVTAEGNKEKVTKTSLPEHHPPLIILFFHFTNIHNNMEGDISKEPLYGVPCKELLTPITDALVALLTWTSIEYRSLVPLVSSLNNNILHDFGFSTLKLAMEKQEACFKPLVRKLAQDMSSRDLYEDARSVLYIFLDLMEGLLNVDAVSQINISSPELNAPAPLRTSSITPRELCDFIGWTPSNPKKCLEEVIPLETEQTTENGNSENNSGADKAKSGNVSEYLTVERELRMVEENHPLLKFEAAIEASVSLCGK